MPLDAPQYLLSLLATLLAAASIPLLHILFLRLRKNADAMNSMFSCFLLSLIVWFAAFYIIKGNQLHFSEEYLSGLAILGFLWLGYMAAMFHLYRGFSHTLLTDVLRMGRPSFEQILSGFAEDTGKQGMLLRRIATMERGKLVLLRSDVLILTPRGKRSGKVGMLFKVMFNMGSGG